MQIKHKELYKIDTILPTYRHCGWRYKDVHAYLCRDGEIISERLSSEYISDYSKGCEAEKYISELFSFEEAQQVKEYLSSIDHICTIAKVNLPVPPDEYAYARCYGDDFNSHNWFTVPGQQALKVHVYCNIDSTQRTPEIDDFFIAYAASSADEECCCCNKTVAANENYRVLVTLDGWTYGIVCDDCSLAQAPELYSSLNASTIGSQDVKNMPEAGKLSKFKIRFRPADDAISLPCAICKISVLPVYPFAICTITEKLHKLPLCKKCSKKHVPQLLQILNQFYACGAHKKFLKRYEHEETLTANDLFKN